MMVHSKRETIPADHEGIYRQNHCQCALNRPYQASIRPHRAPLSELWHASTMCNVRCGDSLLLDSLGFATGRRRAVEQLMVRTVDKQSVVQGSFDRLKGHGSLFCYDCFLAEVLKIHAWGCSLSKDRDTWRVPYDHSDHHQGESDG